MHNSFQFSCIYILSNHYKSCLKGLTNKGPTVEKRLLQSNELEGGDSKKKKRQTV